MLRIIFISFCFFLFTMRNLQAQPLVKPVEVKEKISTQNLQILADKKEGKKNSQAFSLYQGFVFGRSVIGHHANFGRQWLMKSDSLAHSRLSMDTLYFPAIERYANRHTGEIYLDTLHWDFFWAGWQQGIVRGELAGRTQAMLDFNRTTATQSWQYFDFPKKLDVPFTLDFDAIVTKLCRDEPLNIVEFGEILKTHHLEVIRYLNRVFAQDGTLNFKEQQQAFRFLDSLHQRSVQMYFKQFNTLVQQKEKKGGENFLNYDCQNRTTAFVEIASSSASVMADAVYSLVKGSSQFAATKNFFAMGRISEVLMEGLLPKIQDFTNKNSVLYQLDRNAIKITENLKKSLKSIVVETRDKQQMVFAKVGSGTLDFVMTSVQLKAIAQYGIETEQIRVEINHKRQQIIVFIPRQPKLLKELHRDHKLLNISTKYKSGGTWEQIKKFERFDKAGEIGNGDLNGLLESRLPPTEALKMSHQKLHKNALSKTINPLVQAIVSPLMAGAYSDYTCKIIHQ
jgi:hypothetical protein